MSESVVVLTLTGLVVFLSIASIVSNHFHRKDLRQSADGIAKFYKDFHEQNHQEQAYWLNELRQELKFAHAKAVPGKRPRTPQPDPTTVPVSIQRNGSNGMTRIQKERDFATNTGVR